MAWFKCSSELFRTRVVFRLSEPVSFRDSKGTFRVIGFITMLCETADGVIFKSEVELSKKLNISEKIASTIWSICIEEKVLRKDRGGYSAVAWMIEQGILGEEYADPVKSKQRRRKSGEMPAVTTTTASPQLSDEDEFRLTHDGKSPEEWEEMERWRNSPEGKANMAEYQARLNALIKQEAL